MKKQDYYLLVARRCIQGLLVLACIYISLPVIFSGYDHLEVFRIYFRGVKTGDLGNLFFSIGYGYALLLLLTVFFRMIYSSPIDNINIRCSYIFCQIKNIWLYYLITGGFGYFDAFYSGDISISPFLDLILLMIFTVLTKRVYQVYDQSMITNYGLAKKQTHLNYLMYRGSKKEIDAVIVQNDRYIKLKHTAHYYRIKYTPFFLTVSDHYNQADYFKRCIWNLLFSFMIVYLSINGMVEEKNVLRYTGLILMSLLLALAEVPTLYEIIEKVKKIYFDYRKKGKS
ncbi:hypothetical protein A5804_002833 [Enterococcus faecium]|uniref:Uncharacterized protein n=2 Tax=Enterococcus TaxID=1350 RepID=A0AB73NHA7_ENTFC|nr:MULTISPECIES: hypothetical protein [Enterococcus]MEB7518612.1 hypothetical protein [Enterococcus hirae]OTN94159.1 hypothetical protein A5804_002833 [Enterococcus faecium]